MAQVIKAIVWLAARFLARSGVADTLDVCPEGCAYSSIQAAIDDARDGDVIAIGMGTYTEPTITIEGKSLTLRGETRPLNFSRVR